MNRWPTLAAIVALSHAPLVFAAGAPSPSAKVAEIASQPLADALTAFSRQSGLQVVYASELVAGRHTDGVPAGLSPTDALTRLLSGTGLTFTWINERTVSIWEEGDERASRKPIAAADTERLHLAQTANTAADAASGAQANDDSGFRLQEVIVTASKRAEAISKVGGSVSAITGETLAQRSADNLKDYVAFIPGVNLQSQGASGFGVVSIRGIAPQTASASTATYIDEIPVGASGAASRGGWVTTDLNTADLERVEVLKGPQGTLYGASSMGGVVKYVTKAPSLTSTEFTFTEEFTTVEHGQSGVKARGAFTAPLVEGKLGVRASAYYLHEPGFVEDIGFGGKGMGRTNDRGGRLSLLYKPLDDLSIRLNVMAQESATIGLTVVDTAVVTGEPTYGPFKTLRYTREGFENSARLYSAEINYRIGAFDLVSATSYSKMQPDGYSDATIAYQVYGLADTSPDNPANTLGSDHVSKTTQEFRLVSDRMGIIEWMLGGFYQHEKSSLLIHDVLINDPDANFSTRLSSGKLTEYAGFANATLFFSPRFDVSFGYRHSRLKQDGSSLRTGLIWFPDNPDFIATSSRSFSENPSTYLAAARYHFNDNVLLYARAASGYRPGGGRNLPPGAPPDMRDFYTSDKLWSYEIGLKTTALGGRLTVDTAAFWIDWDDIQSFEAVPGTPFIVSGNGGAAVSRGIEFQTAYAPVRELTLGLNAAYTDAYFIDSIPFVAEDGQPLTYIPKWAGAAYAEYARPVAAGWKAIFAGDFQYQSKRTDGFRVPIPESSFVNFRASLRSDRWQFTAYVKNLAGKNVVVGANGGGGGILPNYFVPSTPRTWGLSFTQRF